MGLTYAQWHEGLADLLVRTGELGRPLYLFVDRDDLAQVAGVDDPQRRWTTSASAYLSHVGRTEPFRYEFLRAQGFDPSDPEVPPYLLGLVMSVLAVTEAPVGGAHGVYPRQNALLGRPARRPGATEVRRARARRCGRRGTAGSATEVPRYGVPTARSHPHWTHQGWARSQGIFRHQDRMLVQDFFEDRGIEPGDHLEPTRLVRELESWLRFHRRDGGRLLDLLAKDEAVRDVLADLLESELAGWTGQVARSLGGATTSRSARLRRLVGGFSLGLTVTPDLEGSTIDVGGQPVTLDEAIGAASPSRPGRRQQPCWRTASRYVCPTRSCCVEGESSAYVFDESVEAGGLLQERRPLLGRGYTLLVHSDALARLRLALSAAGAGGYREATGPGHRMDVGDQRRVCASRSVVVRGRARRRVTDRSTASAPVWRAACRRVDLPHRRGAGRAAAA